MKTLLGSIALSLATLSVSASVPTFYDTFEPPLYPVGYSFATYSNGWQASGMQAYVTNGGAYSGQSVCMGAGVTLTNTLESGATGGKIWTDMRIKPSLGIELSDPGTNSTSFYCYFNSNGYVVAASPSGWVVCSNDIWGGTVVPATNGYVRLSIFQDYGTSNQVVFLNDQLILQDLLFVGTPGTYSQLMVNNTDSNCWLDNVWVTTNAGPDSLVGNRNGNAMSDAEEVQRYGYAARTLYVGGGGYPSYLTIQAALNDWRPGDTVNVLAGTYNETLTITRSITFTGGAINLNGNALTVSSGASVSFSQVVNCGALDVALGGAVSFSQSAYCSGTLTVAGTIGVTSGGAVTAATANVTGMVSMSNGTLQVSGVYVTGSGLVDFVGGRLLSVLAGIDMTGTFGVSNTWGTAASMPLPFSDNFDQYAPGTIVTNLGFRGWYASDGTVAVQDAVARSGNAVILPDGVVLSNRISAVGAGKVWTDYYIHPVLGIEPSSLDTNNLGFLAYANANGFLVVAVSNAEWVVCSNDISGAPVVLQSNAFNRVAICQDFSSGTFAVFVANKLVAQALRSPVNLASYGSLVVDNHGAAQDAYLDDVLITTAVPSGMTEDLNHNGLPDAYEINSYGMLAELLPRGTIYRFR